MSQELNFEKSSSGIENPKEIFLEQQEKISALKEIVMKSETAQKFSKNDTKEKVKNIAEKLFKSKARSKEISLQNVSSTASLQSDSQSVYEGIGNKSSIQQISLMSEIDISIDQTSTPLKNEEYYDSLKTSSSDTAVTTVTTSTVPTKFNNDKITLMRKQLEENRLKLAKKASSKQHLEQLFTQLKEKFNSTQQCLEDTTELGRSMNDLSVFSTYSVGSNTSRNIGGGGTGTDSNTDRKNRPGSTVELSSLHPQFNLDKERIKFLENRCRLLERQMEKEKQHYTNNNNSYNLQKLGEKCGQLELRNAKLEDENNKLQEKLQQRQNELNDIKIKTSNEIETTTFITTECKVENDKNDQYQNILSEKKRLEEELKNQVSVIHDITFENECLRTEIADNEKRIQEQAQTIENLKKDQSLLKERIIELENCEKELKTVENENDSPEKKLIANLESDTETNVENVCHTSIEDNVNDNKDIDNYSEKNKFGKPPTNISTVGLHISENLHERIQAEMANKVLELQDDLEVLRKENNKLHKIISEREVAGIDDASVVEKIVNLEDNNAVLRAELQESSKLIKQKENVLMEKTIELNVMNANFKVLEEKLEAIQKTKPLFSNVISGVDKEINVTDLELEIQQLKQSLDESNKAMIKLKLKYKQSEKSLQKLKNSSELHKEVIRLENIREQLEQRITILEEEKKCFPMLETNDDCDKDEIIQNLNQQINELKENIRKKDEALNAIKESDATIRVKSELSEIQLEEEIHQLKTELETTKHLLEDKEKQAVDNRESNEMLMQLQLMELLDKIEKPSKSSSSAESIEIVERLTQQEKAEIEAFNKEQNDAPIKINFVSSELSPKTAESGETTGTLIHDVTELTPLGKSKVEVEVEVENVTISKEGNWERNRKDLLEKLERLNVENVNLLTKLKLLQEEKDELNLIVCEIKDSKDKLENDLQIISKEKDSLLMQVSETQSLKSNTSQELSSMEQSSEVVASLENSETLFEKCEKSLIKLNTELEAYRKANDKKSKFNICKKLAKEAENAYMQLTELLQKVKEASNAVETVTVVETVVAVTAPNGKALAEYEQLTAQNRDLKATIVELRRALDEARELSPEKDQNIDELNLELYDYKEKLQIRDKERIENEERCKKLNTEIERLKEQNQEIREMENERKLEAMKVNNENEKLSNKLKSNDRICKELEKKCEAYEKQKEIMQKLVNDLKKELETVYITHEEEATKNNNELKKKNYEIEQLKQEHNTMKKSLEYVQKEFKVELQNECEQLRETLEINKSLVQEQLNELANKDDVIDKLNQEIIDKGNKIAEIQLNFDKNVSEHKKLVKEFKSLETCYKELDNLTKQQKDTLNRQEQKINAFEAKAIDLDTKNKELQSKNNEQAEKLQKYALHLKKRTLCCREIEAKLKAIEKEHEDLIKQEKKESEKYDKINDDLKEKLQEKSKLLNDSNEELKINMQRYKELKEQSEEKLYELENKLEKKESDLQKLANSFAKLEKQYLSSQANVERLQSDLKESKIIIDDKIKELDNIKTVNEKTDKVNLEDFSKEKIMEKDKLIDKLQIEIKEIRENFAQKTNELKQLEKIYKCEIAQAEENYKTKLREIEELRKIIGPLEGQSSVWCEYRSLNIEDETLSKLLTEKTEQLLENEKTLNSLQNDNKLIIEREQALKEKLNELNEKLVEKEEIIKDLNKKYDIGSVEGVDLINTTPIENQLRLQLKQQEERLNTLMEELNAKSIKIEKSKAVIKDRNNQIHRLQSQLKDLQEKLSSLPEEEACLEQCISLTSSSIKETSKKITESDSLNNSILEKKLHSIEKAYDVLNEKYQTEKANFQDTITRLETLHDSIQAKLREDMSYIETLEVENNKFKDKICRLEECVALFEERRASMERKVKFMDAQMQKSSEEHAKVEDELIYRLNMLLEHDDIIAQRLIESQTEHEDIDERYRQLQSNYNELQSKYQAAERDFVSFKTNNKASHEEEIEEMQERLLKSWSEADVERLKSDYEKKLATQKNELDELENELSEQLKKMNDEKREVNEKLERAIDECTTLKDDIIRLNDTISNLEDAKSDLEREAAWLRIQIDNTQTEEYELQELRMQSVLDKSEIQHLCQQLENSYSTHEIEMQALRTQISELDSLRMQVGQNQTDDQVFIESENKRLNDLLAEKDVIIGNYQRQCMQLQSTVNSSGDSVVTASISRSAELSTVDVEITTEATTTDEGDNTNMESLKQEINSKNVLIARLQAELNSLKQRHLLDVEYSTGASGQELVRSRNDVIPAPPMFFTAENNIPSPFDDLITSHHDDLRIADDLNIDNSLTIEDLQRNVSDLEKHAQDLEHKLAIRTQRDHEHEKRDRLLQQTQAELNALREELLQQQEQNSQIQILEEKLNAKEQKIMRLEKDLNDRTNQLSAFQDKCQQNHILQTRIASLEDQIIVHPKEEKKNQPSVTLDMFFGQPASEDGNKLVEALRPASLMFNQQEKPVIEELIVPKKISECQPKILNDELIPSSSAKFAEKIEVETFNWSDEAAAESKHFDEISVSKQEDLTREHHQNKDEEVIFTSNNKTLIKHSLITNEQHMELRLQEMKNRIQELENAWNANEKEKQEVQMKCAKLAKKVRDYKQKIENTAKTQTSSDIFRKSSSFETNSEPDFNLDAAIQDELGLQIKCLEQKMEEYKKQEALWHTEKDKLMQRIEILTNGNERLLELKESQDEMYQLRIRELQQQLDHLNDWGHDEQQSAESTAAAFITKESKEYDEDTAIAVSDSSQKSNMSDKCNDIVKLEDRIIELERDIQNGIEDRTELQALLEEERLSTNRAEQIVETLRKQLKSYEDTEKDKILITSDLTSKYNNLHFELQNLQEAYNDLEIINMRLKAEHQEQYNILLKTSQAKEFQLMEDSKLLELEHEKCQLIKKENSDKLKQNEKIIDELRKENDDLLDENKALKKQNDMNQMKETHYKVTTSTNGNEDVIAKLQEKDAEIIHLKQRVRDLLNDDQTEKLILEVIGKNQEIDALKNQLNTLSEEMKQKEIEESNNKNILSPQLEDYEEYNTKIRRLEVQNADLLSEKNQIEEELEVLNQHVLENLGKEDTVKTLMLELDTKNIELAELTKTITTLRENNSSNNTDIVGPPDYIALNAQWEAIVDERCGEIAKMWQDHLAQRERDYKAIIKKLQEEINTFKSKLFDVNSDQQLAIKNEPLDIMYNLDRVEVPLTQASDETTTTTSEATSQTTSPEHQITDHKKKRKLPQDNENGIGIKEPDEDSDNAELQDYHEKMRAALESQEMEIVALKEQLAIRSAEYARLAATCDPLKLQEISSEISQLSTVQQSLYSSGATGLKNDVGLSDDNLKVPKSELDLAYYMLHQREMRCEEMNLELVALLEERDTLQLRLSQTLRQLETCKALGYNINTKGSQNVSIISAGDIDVSVEDAAGSTVVANINATINTEAMQTKDDEELNQKLLQLQHSKPMTEKNTKEESDQQQHFRQMQLIQQDVARIPTAAVSELVGTDIRTTNEAPSTALFNWLWGKRNNSNSNS